MRSQKQSDAAEGGDDAKEDGGGEDLAQLQEATMRNILIQKLNEGDLDSLYQYHAFLSEQYGVPLGVFDDAQFEEKIQKKISKIDNTWITNIDRIVEDLRCDGSENLQFVKVQHRQILLSFLQAKDDNLILLICGFLQQIQRNHRIWFDEVALMDLFGVQGLDKKDENAQIQITDKNTGCVSIIKNLLNIFGIQPQYFRIFTLYNCFGVINQFFVQDQRMSLGQCEGESFRKIVDYSQAIPPSLIGHYPELLQNVKDLYKYNLKIIKLYLNDAKIFIEQYYMQN